MDMEPREMRPDVLLKKSPFLVSKRLKHNEVRVFSKLHGNLTTFDFDIDAVLQLFDDPINTENALRKISEIYPGDPRSLIRQIHEKQFLVEGGRSPEEMISEYVEALRVRNRVAKISKVTFLISAKCNLACKGCYHQFFDFRGTDMDSTFAESILKGLFPYLKKRQMRELAVSFLGYEPLVNFETLRNIFDLASGMARVYGIKVSFKIFTNGYSVSDGMLGWVKENRSKLEIKVSLDGIQQDNDRRRVNPAGEGTYNQVSENLRRIIRTGVQCGVLIVLSRLNLANIERFVDDMAGFGIRRITANLFCGQSEDERRLELTDSEKIEAIGRMEQATEKCEIEFDGEWKFAVAQLITGAHFTCPAGIRQLVFCGDGLVYPCQRFAGTGVHIGRYEQGFWEKLMEDRCEAYIDWTSALYSSVLDKGDEKIGLRGWSCPFLAFLRGERIGSNPDGELNEQLSEYFSTRPLNRIMMRSGVDCSGQS